MLIRLLLQARPLRATTALAVVVSAYAIAGCAGKQQPGAVEVTAMAVPGTSFVGYTSYAWARPGIGGADPSRLSELERRDVSVRNAVDQELRGRGLIVRSEGPELLVDYTIDVQFKHAESFRDYAEYRELGGTEKPSKANIFGYDEATLAIVLLDPATKAVRWRGVARGVAYESDNPERRIREAIRQIFREMPPTR